MTTRCALIMAGGSSDRMRASGCKTHKALRCVSGCTLLEHNIRMACEHGFTDISVAVNSSEAELRSWLATRGLTIAEQCGFELRILVEEQPLGTIGSARFFASAQEHLLVVNVDNLADLDLRAFYDFHLGAGAALTVAAHREPFRIPFGQLETVDSRVIAYHEKPVFPITISSGTYMLSNRAMSAIPAGQTIHVPQLINMLIEAGEAVDCFRHTAWWIDVNDEAALALAEAGFPRKAPAAAAAGS